MPEPWHIINLLVKLQRIFNPLNKQKRSLIVVYETKWKNEYFLGKVDGGLSYTPKTGEVIMINVRSKRNDSYKGDSSLQIQVFNPAHDSWVGLFNIYPQKDRSNRRYYTNDRFVNTFATITEAKHFAAGLPEAKAHATNSHFIL